MAAADDQTSMTGWQAGRPMHLSERDFKKFSAYIYDVCGIKLPPVKRTMLSARLNKRLRELRLASFKDYYDYIMSPEGQRNELVRMIDVVTTNKTEFFREAKHFDFLTTRILPDYARKFRNRPGRRLRVWSAGCSSGEEPYTLAMVLDDFVSRHPGLDYAILGTDICTKVLGKAERGIYSDAVVEAVPVRMRQKYMMRGKGEHRGCHRVVPELRNKITFQRLNFLDADFGLKDQMDIIFCRNVIIYFDRPTQATLFNKFYKQIAPGGYMFTGHSESLEGIVDKMERIGSAVYRCQK